MLGSIEVLKEIRESCLKNHPLTRKQHQWLGQSLDAFLTQRCESLRQAFGIQQDRGGVPWWLEMALRTRDSELRLLAERFFSEMNLTAKSRAIETLARRYAASAWRFDRERADMPATYEGTVRECLWRAFKSGAHMPVSQRHLRSLLAYVTDSSFAKPGRKSREGSDSVGPITCRD